MWDLEIYFIIMFLLFVCLYDLNGEENWLRGLVENLWVVVDFG